LIYCRSLKNLFEKAILETDVSFSTQGGPCRLYNEDAVIDLRDLSTQNVKHIWNTRVIYRFRSNNREAPFMRQFSLEAVKK